MRVETATSCILGIEELECLFDPVYDYDDSLKCIVERAFRLLPPDVRLISEPIGDKLIVRLDVSLRLAVGEGAFLDKGAASITVEGEQEKHEGKHSLLAVYKVVAVLLGILVKNDRADSILESNVLIRLRYRVVYVA